MTLVTLLLCALTWLSAVAFLRLKKHKNLMHLLLFTAFFIYIVKVLDYTLFQFQSLLLLRYFTSHLILNGAANGTGVNLIPLVTLTQQDVMTSLLNILLLVPFGFGLPFIANVGIRKVIVVGMTFSAGIELLQFITGLLANMTFRIADINDVIFNTLGVAIGCALFVGFAHVFPQTARKLTASASHRAIQNRIRELLTHVSCGREQRRSAYSY